MGWCCSEVTLDGPVGPTLGQDRLPISVRMAGRFAPLYKSGESDKVASKVLRSATIGEERPLRFDHPTGV